MARKPKYFQKNEKAEKQLGYLKVLKRGKTEEEILAEAVNLLFEHEKEKLKNDFKGVLGETDIQSQEPNAPEGI